MLFHLILYYSPASHTVIVVWLLEELGLKYAIQKFALNDWALREPNYIAVHYMGRVFAMEHKGITLFESAIIIQYILANCIERNFLAKGTIPVFSQNFQ